MSTSSHGLSAHDERPERSRNAKAQARHRAKRKAYIDQLEQTVTKLQSVAGLNAEQVAAIPAPLAKIRELEQENARLQRENSELRRLLAEADGRGLRTPQSAHDPRNCDREIKRRKVGDDIYMSAGHTPPNGNEILSRPPPLTIPPPAHPHTPSQHYSSVGHHGSHQSNGHSSSSIYALHAPAFQMPGPGTPSSSSTSSPPFSQPTQMPQVPQHHASHRTPDHTGISSYPHSSSHYASSVKVEDDSYAASNHHRQQPPHSAGGYSANFHSFSPNTLDHDSWPAYSSDRHDPHLVR